MAPKPLKSLHDYLRMIEYFTIEGFDRQMFRCERLRASLFTDSCASNWKSANDGNEKREACRSCPIGAMHAGEELASCSPLKGSLTCARCARTSSRGWLLDKHLCVSCWNRQREWTIGKNAKGSKPSKMRPLDPRSIHFTEAGAPRTISRPLTEHPEELVLAALRDSKGTVTFMPNKLAGMQMRQGVLF